MNPYVNMESILFDDDTTVSSGLTQVLETGELGPATTPEQEVDDGKPKRPWYITVYPGDELKKKLLEEFDERLLKLPFKTNFSLIKAEQCPDTDELHFHGVFSSTKAWTFKEVRNKFTTAGWKNPNLAFFRLTDKKTLARHLRYTCKELTTWPGDLGTIRESGDIKGLTPQQWLHKYDEDREKRAGGSIKAPKKSAKEEARDYLKPYVAELHPWENLEQLLAKAADDEGLLDVLCLNLQVAKDLLKVRDAKARLMRRERKGLFILIGAAGTSKTTRANNDGRPEEMPVKSFVHNECYDEPYSAYVNHERVVLDEFSGRKLKYDAFKMLTDNNNTGGTYERPVKNRDPITYNHEEVWAMSNRDPSGWYANIWKQNPNELDAFIRRVFKMEVAMRWRVSDINDPTSVVMGDDGLPIRNCWVQDGPPVQFIDLTERLKGVRSMTQFRELTLFYRDQLPSGHALGLSSTERDMISGSSDPYDLTNKRPREEYNEHGLFKYARTGVP